MSSYLDKKYMEERLQDRIKELERKYRALCSNRLEDGTDCTANGAAVNRSRQKREISTLKLFLKVLSFTRALDIDDGELVDAFDRLVEPRRKKWST